MELSPYRKCNECFYIFKLPRVTLLIESKKKDLEIFCPRCNSNIIGLISLSQYIGEIKHFRGKQYGKIEKCDTIKENER